MPKQNNANCPGKGSKSGGGKGCCGNQGKQNSGGQKGQGKGSGGGKQGSKQGSN